MEEINFKETFFANKLANHHQLSFTENGYFLIDEKYTFEIGGKNKNDRQIKESLNSFIAADDIEYGYGNKTPLWLFGFLY